MTLLPFDLTTGPISASHGLAGSVPSWDSCVSFLAVVLMLEGWE